MPFTPTTRRAAALAVALTAAAFGPTRAARAQFVTDPAGDFLPTYVGPRNGDMDVIRAAFTFDGTAYHFTSRSAGSLGTTAGALFVWGVDRGQGTARFGALAPGVLFDAVVVVDPFGTTTVRDLISGAATTLPVGAVRFSGADLFADVSAALLPSLGFTASQYTANLWPRVGAGNTAISDFAPDNSNIAVTATPEPATLLLVLPAMAAVAVVRRRRAA